MLHLKNNGKKSVCLVHNPFQLALNSADSLIEHWLQSITHFNKKLVGNVLHCPGLGCSKSG